MEDLINITRIQTIEEYLAELDEEKSSEVRWLLDNSLPVINQLNLKYGGDYIPEIRIINNPCVGAEATSFVIRINSGLIDHILSTHPLLSRQELQNNKNIRISGNLFSLLNMVWVLAHEWVHIIRHHDELKDHIEITNEVSQAMEFDADLCATAEVYRLLQRLYSSVWSDLQIRQYAMFSLFWAIRTLPNYGHSGSHGSHIERLFHVAQKLVVMGENHTDKVDASLSQASTRARIEPINKVAFECESFFQRVHNNSNEKNMVESWGNYMKVRGHTDLVLAWEKISPLVAKLSNTKTA